MANSIIAGATPGVSAQVLAIAFNEIAMLLRTGINLDAALAQVAHTGPPHFRRAMLHLSSIGGQGQPLSGAMRGYSTLFHPVVPAVIQGGEATGNLDYCFQLLADFFEKEAELKRVVTSALLYPGCTVIAAIAAVGILAYINFMPSAWFYRLVWGVAILAGFWLLYRLRFIQTAVRFVAMMMPFFGGIMHQLSVANFCQTFGMLIRAGVPYLEGLEVTMPVVQHPMVNRAVQFVYTGVRNGSTVEDCIRNQVTFPHIVRNLVASGETAGSLDDALIKAAEFLRNSAEYKIKNSAKFVGPCVTVVVGIIVLLILLAFWSSYFQKIFSILE